MRPPLHIAILECDDPIGRAKAKYGGYGNLFKELLERSAQNFAERTSGKAPQLDVTKYDVVNHEVYPALEDVDAILISGSKFNSFDNDPWILKLVEYTKKVLLEQSRVRVIGVCFGHQIIGRALGVKVGKNTRGWEYAVTSVELSEKGKELFGIQELAIHQMHRDIVYSFPNGVESLGKTEVCEVQGMYAKNRLISVQGHPEFYGDIVEDIINNRHRLGVFDETQRDEGLSRVRNHHDGLAVGTAFIRFLLDD